MTQPPKTQNGESPRVLVVDDEPTIRKPLVRALELTGYQAVGAASGKEALALLEQVSYDVMLLDMKMPEMDGMQVMDRARQLQPDLLIFILTGHATLESAIAAVIAEGRVRTYDMGGSATTMQMAEVVASRL